MDDTALQQRLQGGVNLVIQIAHGEQALLGIDVD